MKEILETMPRIELALIIIGATALMLGIIFGYAMIHEYRMYLENHFLNLWCLGIDLFIFFLFHGLSSPN